MSDQITIIEVDDQITIVEQDSGITIVEVPGLQGPPGIQGEPGPPGSGSGSFDGDIVSLSLINDTNDASSINVLDRKLTTPNGATVLDWSDGKVASTTGVTYFDDSGFHGDGGGIAYADQVAARQNIGLINESNLAGGTVLTIGQQYHDSFSEDRTLTITGTPVDGDRQTILRMFVTTPITLTFWESYRIAEESNPITSLGIPVGYHEIIWACAGGVFWMVDDIEDTAPDATWGGIAGDITDQADLQDALGRLNGPFTVATLPDSPTQGDTAFVTDANTPTYLAIVAGSGSTITPVFYDGTNWVCH